MKKFTLFFVALLVMAGNAIAQTIKSAYVPTGYGSSVEIHYEVADEDAKTCRLVAEDAPQAKGTISMQYSGNFDLPTEIDGYTVISIERYAFGCTRCTITKLPEKQTNIKIDAFYLGSDANSKARFADTLYIPATAVRIEAGAFRKSLVNHVVLPEGFTSIEGSAFSESTFSGITLPSTLNTIGGNAFYKTKLSKISLPEGLAGSANNAFSYTPVDSVLIPASLTSFGEQVFRGCQELVSLKVAEGSTLFDAGKNVNNVLYIASGNRVVAGCKTSTLPGSTVIVNEYAFEEISGLESITIPSTLTTICTRAFAYTGLKYLKIPATVQELQYGAFASCDSLERVDCMGDCRNITINGLAVSLSSEAANNPKLKGVYFHDIYPAKVTEAGKNSFFSGMQNVTLYYPKPTGAYNWFAQTGGYVQDPKIAHRPYTSFFKQGKEYKEVSSIGITDYEWPEAGSYGDYDVTCTTEGVDHVDVQYNMFSRVVDFKNSKFAVGDNLAVRMNVYLSEGYVFSASPTCKIDDQSADSRIIRFREDRQDFAWSRTATIPTGGVPIESASCSLPAPEVGEVPADYITSPSGRFL